MALYKQKGVNPGQRLRADAADAAGPVRVLRDAARLAIELRGAPFVGWIHDLSRKDPLYICAGADGRARCSGSRR